MRMIERVARAICKAQTQSEQVWQAFLPEANAAIEAMREPTDAMIDAIADAEGTCWESGSAIPVKSIYTAAIDAALNEQVP